jgi:threonine dehydrogenase-like Zn-dependent dehydrogenase
VAEKAIEEAVRLQLARLPDAAVTPNWLYGQRCLVAGLGPIGLLAALALRLRGAEVYGLDIVDAGASRPQWLAGIGGHYVDGRQVAPDRVDDTLGPMALVFEATGVADLEFNLLDALAINGVYVLTGVPSGNRPLQIPGAHLVRQLVLKNQVVVGSVNAARAHFQMAVEALAHAAQRWGVDFIARLITHRYHYKDFDRPLHQHDPNEIKVVIEWSDPA